MHRETSEEPFKLVMINESAKVTFKIDEASEDFINYLKQKNIFLIEDVCESHGALLGKKKLGVFGLISNFSFYYAHHLSTIEGGMVCTNDKKVYELARLLRSHGMARELSDKRLEKKNN